MTGQEKIYNSFSGNALVWGYYYHNNHFRVDSPPFHLKILFESEKNQFFAAAAPRGSAKSTIISFLKVSHKIVFKKKRFIVIVQNTYNKAVGTLETIKAGIRDNEQVKNDYGIMFRKDSEGDTIFRHPDGFETRVLVKGSEQIGSVRGEKFGAYRPDYIVIDDLEDDEMVKNPERRMYLQNLFDNALIPSGDVETLEVDVIGTILHDDSLMAKLVSKEYYKEYKKLLFKARYEDNGKQRSLWDKKWSVEWLNEFEKDKPLVFAQEMQNNPSSGALETIKREDFRYWREEEGKAVLYGVDNEVISKWGLLDCRAAVGIDLAWETKKTSDFAAIIPGLVTPSNELLICDYVYKRGLRPDEFENIVFDMNDRYEKMTGKRVQFGFEKANLEKVMKWFLEEAMKRRGKYLWFKDISWGTSDKIARIMFRIANRYSQHSVYHKKGMGDLENQLIRLRSSAHDDLADALAMLPEMLYYGSVVQKKVQPVDRFMELRKQTQGYREKNVSNYMFGKRIDTFPFRNRVALI